MNESLPPQRHASRTNRRYGQPCRILRYHPPFHFSTVLLRFTRCAVPPSQGMGGANMVSSTVSTRHRKLLAVAAFPFAECAAAGGSTAPAVDAAGCPIAECDCQFSRQRVYNLALLCHRQSRARRRRQTGSIAIDSAAGLPVAALAALVSETPRTISGEQLAMKLKLPHDKWFEWFEP